MKIKPDIQKFFSENGGVASVNELAALIDCDEGAVRRWARDNNIRRIGSTFVFSLEVALVCADTVPVSSGVEFLRGKVNQDAMMFLRKNHENLFIRGADYAILQGILDRDRDLVTQERSIEDLPGAAAPRQTSE